MQVAADLRGYGGECAYVCAFVRVSVCVCDWCVICVWLCVHIVGDKTLLCVCFHVRVCVASSKVLLTLLMKKE
jgi:hypothetical protein